MVFFLRFIYWVYAARFVSVGPALDTAESISKAGDASAKTHLRKDRKHHTGNKKSGKQQGKHQDQKRRGGEACRMVPEQIFHCSPRNTCIEQRKGGGRSIKRGTALY